MYWCGNAELVGRVHVQGGGAGGRIATSWDAMATSWVGGENEFRSRGLHLIVILTTYTDQFARVPADRTALLSNGGGNGG